MPQREALQVALQEGGNSLMHESFHLVVLLRRAVAEIGEKVGEEWEGGALPCVH